MPDRITQQGTPLVLWQRYWTPAGTAPTLDYAEYLSELFYQRSPTDRPIRVTNHEARTLGQLADLPCLVLLGEPGAGKSTELHRLGDPEAVRIDLGRIGGEAGFLDRVSRDPRLREWKEGGRPLTLVLDAYDEAFLHVDAAAALLEDAITDGLPTDRDARRERARSLRLRITSRGGVWRKSITTAFESLWGAPNVGVYTLAPLRRADVVQAAEAWGLPPDEFQAALRESGVESLGALPLTLTWLLGIYRDRGSLPHTWHETLDLAVLRLCTEHNPGRRNADRDGHCTPEQRVAIAGRLAAIMRFGDRATLSLGSEQVPAEGVLLGADVGGEERDTDGAAFSVDRDALRDLARDTTLFQSAEPDHFRWTQAAIADYLAAWYLRHRGASLRQSLSLLTDPDDGRAVPQLVSVAACVASLDPEVFLALAERDPGVALGAEGVQDHPEGVRQQGVELYLRAVAERQLHIFIDPFPTSLRTVSHPGLADQLKRWIDDPDRGEDERMAAVRMASQNRLTGLASLICDLSLDETAPPALRTTAVHAVEWIGSPDDRTRLRPILQDLAPGEDGDRLRLAARDVLWPDHLSVQDLVASAALDESGPHDIFARDLRWRRLFAEDIASEKIVEVLDWITQGDPSTAPDIAAGALVAAGHRAGEDEVGRRLAPLLIRYADRDEREEIRLDTHPVQQALAEQEGERLPFLTALIAALVSSDNQRTMRRMLRGFAPVRVEDGVPLIERVLDAPSDTVRGVCTVLLQSVVSPSEEGIRGELWSALQEAAPHRAQIEAVVTQAVVSAEARLAHGDQQVRDVLTPPISDRIEAALTAPQPDRWQQATVTLALDPNRSPAQQTGAGVVSPSVLPAWSVLSPEQRDRVTDAAEAYVRSTAPGDADWVFLEEHGGRTVAVADGIRALALLHRMGRPIPDETRAVWAPALLFRWPHTHEEEPDFYALLKQAYRTRPDALLESFERLISINGVRIGTLARPFGILSDSGLDQLLFGALDSGRIHEDDRRTVLEGLLQRGTPGATEYAMVQVDQAESPASAAWEAFLLFTTQPVEAWTRCADRVRDDDEFTRYLLLQIADKSRGTTLPTGTPVESLVTLERRLEALYPPEDDPPAPPGIHSPSREDRIRNLRAGFAGVLATQGTDASISAIHSLRDVLSEDTLRYQLMRARQRRREEGRRPIEPSSLLDLLRDRTARLARSADELFAVVTETLGDHFETWLRAPRAPRVYDLWNHVPRSEALRLAASVLRHDGGSDALAGELDAHRTSNKKGRITSLAFPRDEGALSDAALRFLREHLGPGGALVDREVEVQRGHATDLLVSIPASERSPQATVVIEVKSSWHNTLYQSLDTQLAQGYLDGATLRHGIYLVGWYGPEEWYDVAPGKLHSKARAARKGGPGNVRERLTKEAIDATTADRHVVAIVVDASLPPARAS